MTEPAGLAAGTTRDFTLPMEPFTFTIDKDTFKAPAILAPVTLKRIAERYKSLSGIGALMTSGDAEAVDRALQSIAGLFEAIMPGPSGKRFARRMLADGSELETPEANPNDEDSYVRPLDITRQVLPALHYLLECYGLRPTRQSSPLPSDSGTGDLTDGAQAEESTGAPSATPLSS